MDPDPDPRIRNSDLLIRIQEANYIITYPLDMGNTEILIQRYPITILLFRLQSVRAYSENKKGLADR
jgi:hypothetical protein